MTRAALIGATLIVATPALLFVGAVLGWLSRDQEDNAELARMRKVAAEADAILAAIQDPPPNTIPAQRTRYKLTCPTCGPLELATDICNPVPVTDTELHEALEVILTEHAIEAHLAEWSA